MTYRVVITGLGCVSPYGLGVNLFWKNLLDCRSALKYDSNLKSMVGRIPSEELENEHLGKEMSRSSRISLIAAEEAFEDSGLKWDNNSKMMENVGINVGKDFILYFFILFVHIASIVRNLLRKLSNLFDGVYPNEFLFLAKLQFIPLPQNFKNFLTDIKVFKPSKIFNLRGKA